MKRLLLAIMALAIAFAADAKPNKSNNKELNLRVGTYNVWAHYARQGLVNRKKALPERT